MSSGGEIQKNSAAIFHFAKFLTDEKDCQLPANDHARGVQVNDLLFLSSDFVM